MPIEEFLEIWQKASNNRNWQPPIGDSSINAGKRLEKIINDNLKSPHENIVFVTHGGITVDFLRNVIPTSERHKFSNNFKNSLEENVKECSITIVESENDDANLKLLQLGNVSHLEQI